MHSRNPLSYWLMRAQGAQAGPHLDVLRNRQFRSYLAASLFESIGFWSQFIIVAYVLIRDGGSATHLGLAAAIAGIPAIVLTFYGGAIADRIPRRLIVVGAELILAANAFSLAILEATGELTFTMIYLSIGLAAVTSGFGMPALMSIARDLVEPDQLASAISLDSLKRNSTKLIGPALGAAVLGLAGASWAFTLAGLAFLSFAIVVLGLKFNQRLATGKRRTLTDIREAFDTAIADPRIGAVLLIIVGVGLFGINEMVMCPLLARNVLGAGPEAFGLTVSAAGAGSIIGGIVSLCLPSVTMRRVVVSAAGLAVSLVAMGLVGDIPQATLPLLVIWGCFGTLMLTGASALLQALTPAELEGRMMSFYALGIMGTTPLGSVLLAVLVAHSDIEIGLMIFGFASLACVSVGLAYVVRRKAWKTSVSQRL